MLDIRSPLTAILQTGRYGADFDAGPGITLSEAPAINLVQIAGWEDFEVKVLPNLTKLGFNDTGDYRQCRNANGMNLYRISPDRILIASTSPIMLPDEASLAVLDLSHARTKIIIDGPASEEVMARLVAIDCRKTAMPVNDFVQTGIHHIGVLIHRTSTSQFEILVPVTWARSVWEFICLNAAPFGYEVKEAV